MKNFRSMNKVLYNGKEGLVSGSSLTIDDKIRFIDDKNNVELVDMDQIKTIYNENTRVVYTDVEGRSNIDSIVSFKNGKYQLQSTVDEVSMDEVSLSLESFEFPKPNLDGWMRKKEIVGGQKVNNVKEVTFANIKLESSLFVFKNLPSGDNLSSLVNKLDGDKLKADVEIQFEDKIATLIQSTDENNVIVQNGLEISRNNIQSIIVLNAQNAVKTPNYRDLMVQEHVEEYYSGTDGSYEEESGWQSSWAQPKWATSSSSDEKSANEMVAWSSDSEGAWATSSTADSVESKKVNESWAVSDSEDIDDLSAIISSLEKPHADAAAWASEDDTE